MCGSRTNPAKGIYPPGMASLHSASSFKSWMLLLRGEIFDLRRIGVAADPPETKLMSEPPYPHKKKETNKPTKEKEKKITNEQLLFLQGVILSSVDLVHQVENVFLHCRPVLSRPSVRCCIPNVRFCALTPQVKSLWMDHILSMQRRGRKVNGKSVQSQQFAMVYNGQPTTARHWPAAQVSLTNLYGCRACG